MKVVYGIAMRVAPWAIPVLTAAILVLDVITPLGTVVWMLYAVPLALTWFSPRERDPLSFSIILTLLVTIGFFASPPALAPTTALFNRMLGLCLLWTFALAMVRLRKARADEERAVRELLSERVERAHAEGLMIAAQKARSYADTALLGAAAGRRVAEEKLLVSQLRLEGIIQSAMDAIITVDQDQRVVLFNQAAERLFQVPAEKAIGESVDRFIPQRFREAHREHVQEYGKAGTTSRKMGALGTITGLRANGEEFPAEAAISQVSVEGKKYFTVILRDIRERKRLEEAQAHLASIVASSEDAIIGESLDGVVLSWNRAAEEMSGFSAQEVIGRPLGDFLPKEDAEKERNFLAIVARGDSIQQYETVRVRKDGQPLYVSLTISPIRNEQGGVIGASRIVRDITEKKQLQEQLRRTERIAELGTLASGMAHEIGTPMNVILGRAEYLMERVREAPIRKGLQVIVSQVERITRVMNQLLAFARRRPVERRRLDLQQTIKDNLDIFQERLAGNRIKVETAFANSCPPVYADADQMSQVIINLVMNAIHAMPDGGCLQITLTPADGVVKLIVADSGHGIPPDVKAKIFDPFFTTKEFGKGTGLGLTVVKGIIEEHGGSIAVESEPGKGTVFTLSLPAFAASGDAT